MKIKLTFFASLVILLAIACQNAANSNATTAAATADSLAAAAAAKVKDSAATAMAKMVSDSMKMDSMHMAMASAKVDSAVVYVCPMHPKEIGKKGDKCPICKMAMVPKSSIKPAPAKKAAH